MFISRLSLFNIFFQKSFTLFSTVCLNNVYTASVNHNSGLHTGRERGVISLPPAFPCFYESGNCLISFSSEFTQSPFTYRQIFNNF